MAAFSWLPVLNPEYQNLMENPVIPGKSPADQA